MQWQPLCAVCVIERLPVGNVSFFRGIPYSISSHLKRGMNVPWSTWHFPWEMHARFFVCLGKKTGTHQGTYTLYEIWHSTTSKYLKLKKNRHDWSKTCKILFVQCFKKEMFHIQLKLGVGLNIWWLHISSYNFGLNAKVGEVSRLISFHDSFLLLQYKVWCLRQQKQCWSDWNYVIPVSFMLLSPLAWKGYKNRRYHSNEHLAWNPSSKRS